MPSLTWYRRRLQTMSASELGWRMVSALCDAELYGRLVLRLEPRPGARRTAKAATLSEPGFCVCDVRVGEWALPQSDEERMWRDRLVDRAERIARHRLSFFDLRDRDL